MKPDELRKKDKEELEKLLEKKREALQEAKFQLSSGRVKNVKKARNLRKTIARILTILNEKSHA